jgi:serine/threonine kinase 16
MITLQQYFWSFWNWLINWLSDIKEQWFGGRTIDLDSGIRVRLGRELAQGGYSVVYRGSDAQNPHLNYAVKRIHCYNDPDLRLGCIEEAKVHRTLQKAQEQRQEQEQRQRQPQQMHFMPLHGMTFEENNTICYMVFPYLPHSLRQEVNLRIFYPAQASATTSPPPPWSESMVLKLFDHLCEGVALMHSENLAHRDIKLENVLFQGSNTMHLQAPVLVDFGSAGPLSRTLANRKDVLEIAEQASQHTTMPYRPPELFSGELRVGDSDLDYTEVDVWSLGCTLFAILYGASPFECEFTRNRRGSTNKAPIRIVDCSQSRVLGNIPKPQPNTAVEKWYSPQVLELIDFILEKDRNRRPTLQQVQVRVKALLNGETVDVEDPMNSLFSKDRHDGW